jgi:signal peptidase I
VINGWLVPHCHVGTFQSEGKAKELYVEFLAGKSYFTLFNQMGREEACKQSSDCGNGQSCLVGICVSERKGPYKVAPNEVWVLGDNRDNSHDSRGWRGGLGAGVPFENIKGRAMFVFATFGPDNGDFWDRFLVNVMGRPQLPSVQMQLQPAVDKCMREAPKETTPPPPK